VDDLIAWLKLQVKMDGERTGRILGLAESMYSAWQPSNPYSFADQADDVRDEYIHAATVAIDEQMPGVLAECDAKRKVIKLYENALAAHRRGSISERNNVQDEAAVDVLGAAVQAYGEMYAKLGRPGHQESWRPA
jgi:hypothetical protein